MPTRTSQNIDSLLASVKQLQEEIEALKAGSTPPDDKGLVRIKPAGDERHNDYSSTFKAGSLTLNFDALVDVQSGRLAVNTESMNDASHGRLFTRTMNHAPSQIIMTYDFGPSVEGAETLTFIGENTPQSRIVYGSVDGKEILPMRYDKATGCGCAKSAPMVMVANEDGTASPLNIKFPDAYKESLAQLIPVIENAIANERYAPESLALCAASGCFWASLACEVAAKACILGCPTTGPLVAACIAACLAAEVACLAAVQESKTASTGILI